MPGAFSTWSPFWFTAYVFSTQYILARAFPYVVAYESCAVIGRRAEPVLMVGASGSAHLSADFSCVRTVFVVNTREGSDCRSANETLVPRNRTGRAWCCSLATGSTYAAVA
jgi:hypothetical protein